MATAAVIANYKDNLTRILPPALIVNQAFDMSVMTSKNEIIVGLTSVLNGVATFDQFANLTISHGAIAVYPEYSSITINDYTFYAKTAANVTNRDFLLPPAATFAAFQETFKSLFMTLKRHTILSAKYTININSNYSQITLRAKNVGEADNISFSQDNFAFGVVNNTVDAFYLAGTLDNYKFILDVFDEGETINGYNYRHGLPSTSTTQARNLITIEKSFNDIFANGERNTTLFDISDVLRTQLITYKPIHRNNTNFTARLWDCPRQFFKYYLRYSDVYINNNIADFEIGDEIASDASTNFNDRSYSALHASLPKNLTQIEIAQRCSEKIINTASTARTYLTNWQNGSGLTNTYDISKLIHFNQREFLYFIYLIFPNSSNRDQTVSFNHRLVYENGNIQDVEVPYQFNFLNTFDNTISNTNLFGTVYYAEIGIPAVLNFLATSLSALETAQNSRLNYMRVNMITTNSGGSKVNRGEYRYYKFDNANRFVENYNQCQIFYRNDWGGIDSLFAYSTDVSWATGDAKIMKNSNLRQVFDKNDKENQVNIQKYKNGETSLRLTCRLNIDERWNYDNINECIKSTEFYIKHQVLDKLSSSATTQQIYNAILETSEIISSGETDLQTLELVFRVENENNIY